MNKIIPTIAVIVAALIILDWIVVGTTAEYDENIADKDPAVFPVAAALALSAGALAIAVVALPMLVNSPVTAATINVIINRIIEGVLKMLNRSIRRFARYKNNIGPVKFLCII